MPINAAMKAEMERPFFLSAFLMQLELSTKTLRLLDGVGEVYYGNQVFRGSDDEFGMMITIDPLQEQVGTEAPLMRMKFMPENNTALAKLTDPSEQGAPFSIWWAVLNRDTGAIIGEPYLVYSGELDAAEADIDKNETTVTIDIASVWERLFMNGEGMRLNNAQHSHTWAERAAQERGFEYVVAIQRNEPWGYDGARPAIVADTIGGNLGSNPNIGTGVGGGSGYGGGGGGSSGGGRGGGGNDMVNSV